MWIRAAVLLCLLSLVTPASSDDPDPKSEPAFYFTRLMYNDIYGRGPGAGGGSGFRGFRGGRGAWMTDRIQELPLTHEIFHTFFDIDRILQVPNVRLGEMYTMSGGRSQTREQPSDTEPRVLGISDDTGRLMVLITHNSDLGDAWEWMDDPDYPALFTGYAYRLGMNSIMYTMTH